MIIPFLWSIVGFTAAFNFWIWEGAGLLDAGLLTLGLLWIKNRKITSARRGCRIVVNELPSDS